MNAASFFPGTYANWQRGERSSDSFIVCRVWELHLYPSHSRPLPFPLFLLVARSLSQNNSPTCHKTSTVTVTQWLGTFPLSAFLTPSFIVYMFSFSRLNKPSGDEFKHWFVDFTLHVKTDTIGVVSWLDWGSSEWTVVRALSTVLICVCE